MAGMSHAVRLMIILTTSDCPSSNLKIGLPCSNVRLTPRNSAFADSNGLWERAGFHLPIDRRDVERRLLLDRPFVEKPIRTWRWLQSVQGCRHDVLQCREFLFVESASS
jgi:hypothetical protein